MKLRYTRKALAELDDILTYIEEHSPQGARNVQRRLHQMVGLLVVHPLAGQLRFVTKHCDRARSPL